VPVGILINATAVGRRHRGGWAPTSLGQAARGGQYDAAVFARVRNVPLSFMFAPCEIAHTQYVRPHTTSNGQTKLKTRIQRTTDRNFVRALDWHHARTCAGVRNRTAGARHEVENDLISRISCGIDRWYGLCSYPK
jgi:hypothetical protein